MKAQAIMKEALPSGLDETLAGTSTFETSKNGVHVAHGVVQYGEFDFPDAIQVSADSEAVPQPEVMSANERIEQLIDTAELKFVPDSVEAAERIATKLRELNDTVKQSVAAEAKVGKTVDPYVAESLDTLAAQGTDIWKLSKREESLWRSFKDVTSVDDMDSLQLSLYNQVVDTDQTEAEGLATIHAQAEARRKLDAALRDKHTPASHVAKAEVAELETTEVVSSEISDGAVKEFYRALKEAEDAEDNVAEQPGVEAAKSEYKPKHRGESEESKVERTARRLAQEQGHELPAADAEGLHNVALRELFMDEAMQKISTPGRHAKHDLSKPWTELKPEEKAVYFDNLRAAQEPVTDVTPSGLRGRVRNMFASAKEKLGANKKRRVIMTVAAAALAVSSLGGASHSEGDTAHANAAPEHHEQVAVQEVAPKTTTHVQKVVRGTTLHPKKFETVTLHDGDTIWGIEKAHHPRMGEEHLRKLVLHDLHRNHLTEHDAERLQNGSTIKILR